MEARASCRIRLISMAEVKIIKCIVREGRITFGSLWNLEAERDSRRRGFYIVKWQSI